nr:hypothetical protein [Tanacetum cinerariifolium]
MEMKLAECALKITKNLISEMLGIRNERIDIMTEEGNRNEEMVSSWMMQYVMGQIKPKGFCDLKILDYIRPDTDLGNINWCQYVLRCLQTCKEEWTKGKKNCFFRGPLTFLTMAYIDGSKCSSVNVIFKIPPTVLWTSELLREREDEELNSGGFGFGEIEGPFVEQEDPMPDNIEEKTEFEKTLEAAEYMFPGEMEGFFERYVDALKYQGSRKEGTGNGNILDENKAADAQAGGQNNDGDNNILGDICTVDDNILGSPTLYNMGPETQEEVLRSVDDVEARIERRKCVDMSDIPSFSLGVTQDFALVDEDMAYVDGSKCSSVNVIHKRPRTEVWTSELLKEREDEELNSGGFGFGEIEGPFVEQEDPMPDNIEEKTGFEKTLDATEYMFSGELEGFFERYVDVLKYQGSRKEGIGNANISDENRAADAQADGQNNDGDNNILGDIGMDQGRVVDNIRVTSLRDKHVDVDMDHEGTVGYNILGSPILYNMGPYTQSLANELVDKLSNENRFGSPSLYNMGPETQEEVLRSVDDVDARIKRRKWVDMSDIPSTAVGRLRHDKDKRPVTISEVTKSPFIGRVVDADGSLNATEKRVTKYLFEVLEDHSVTLFETISGQQSTRIQMQTLAQREYVDNNILDTWGSILNHMEVYRSKESPFIMFLPTFVVKEDFGQYLMLKNHSKAENFIGSEIEDGEFDWQTNNMETEAGIFVMQHMETYMVMGMDELNCCLAGNTRKLKKTFVFKEKIFGKDHFVRVQHT